MTAKTSTGQKLTPEEIEELRAYVDAGIHSVSNTNLEGMERLSGPLKPSEILFFATIGASKKRAAGEN